jgi:molybdenum cofactor cytidylyltransferase
METVSCIVPAAGRSSRMGLWKPLLPFRGSTIIQTVLTAALSVCERLIVVTGYREAELKAVLHGAQRVTLTANPGWEMGMFSSIQRGVSCVDTDRFFIVLADKPFIRPEVYVSLLHAESADAIFPVFDGKRGHPVLLSNAVREAVLAGDPMTGSMRSLLSGLNVEEIPWPDDSILRDIDTREQYDDAVDRS